MGTEHPAFQTILKNGATVIGNLISVGLGGMKMEVKDTTHHGLTDAWRTKRAVLGDAQPIKAKVQMTSAQFATLWGMFDPTAANTTWTITYPFSTPIVVTMSGFMSDISSPDAEVDGILEVELEITTSGKTTVA